MQVILATGISFGAMLHDRFGLPIIRDLGGIPPGHWSVHKVITLDYTEVIKISTVLCRVLLGVYNAN